MKNNNQTIKNGEKEQNNLAENETTKNIKKDEKHQKKLIDTKNKIIKIDKKSQKQKMDNSQNKNNVTNIKKGEKRKMDHIHKGPNKKQKFSDKKYKSNKEPSALESMTDDRLKAYGINPKKFRNKLKFGNN